MNFTPIDMTITIVIVIAGIILAVVADKLPQQAPRILNYCFWGLATGAVGVMIYDSYAAVGDETTYGARPLVLTAAAVALTESWIRRRRKKEEEDTASPE